MTEHDSVPLLGYRYRHHREMMLVGELYHQLRLAGVDAYLETRIPSDLHKSGEMRVDLAVLRDGDLFGIVEVKKNGQHLHWRSRQARAYRAASERLKVRVLFVNDEETIRSCVEFFSLRSSSGLDLGTGAGLSGEPRPGTVLT